jgi:hypothetical protein
MTRSCHLGNHCTDEATLDSVASAQWHHRSRRTRLNRVWVSRRILQSDMMSLIHKGVKSGEY